MRLPQLDSPLDKTLCFLPVHLLIAVAVGYALTGSWVFAGLLALLEPLLNTGAHYSLEQRWRGGSAVAKAAVFGAMHLAIATALGWALTGSLVQAGAFALVEPAANTAAHLLFDRWWQRRRAAALSQPA